MYQPSMMSRNFYQNENVFYNETYANTLEDYELWYRLKDKKKFANIDKPLTHYKLSTAEELMSKKTKGNFEENLERLWSVKWGEISETIAEKDKKLFQYFLYNKIVQINLVVAPEAPRRALSAFEYERFAARIYL